MAVGCNRPSWASLEPRGLLLFCLLAWPRVAGAEPLAELRLRALRWSEEGGASTSLVLGRAPRLLPGVGAKALVVDCPPGVEPRRLAIKETSTLAGPFSRGRWQAGRWYFDEARVGGVAWALSGRGCRVSYQQRRLLSRGFARLEWAARETPALRAALKRLQPFERLAQRWLEEAKSPRAWLDRYRLLRPAPALGALRRDPSMRGASPRTFSPWIDREGEDRQWSYVKSPRFVVSGPARVDIRVRRLGAAPAVCLKVGAAKSCQLSPDAKAPQFDGAVLRQPPMLFEARKVSGPLRWRVLLPHGEHQLRVDVDQALVQARAYTLSSRWGGSAAAPASTLIYAPGAWREERALAEKGAGPALHWRAMPAIGHESEDLQLMLPARGPTKAEDWRWIPLGEGAARPGASWIDDSKRAALWLPEEKPCELRFASRARWVGAPRRALNYFLFTGKKVAQPAPRTTGCRVWLRARGREAVAPSAGELVLRRFTRAMAGTTLDVGVASGSDVSALDLSWPETGAQPVALVAELATGKLLHFELRPRSLAATGTRVLAADRTRWSMPERLYLRASIKRVRFKSAGSFALRLSSRLPGRAPDDPPRMVAPMHPPAEGTIAGLRAASRRIAAAPQDAMLRLRRAALLESMGLPRLAAADYLWARLARPQDLAHLAAYVARLSARALFGDGTWRPATPGWLPWKKGKKRPSAAALRLARREDYLALLESRLGDGLLERVGRWRRAILGGQVLDERQRLAAYRMLEELSPSKRRESQYWPLRALSRWVALSLVRGHARRERRAWPLDRYRDPIAPYRDALFPRPWPLERAARLTFGREIALPPVATTLSLSTRCLQRRPERAGKSCLLELVDEKGKLVKRIRVPDGGVARTLEVPPLGRLAYLRVPAASSALQQVLLSAELARPLLQRSEQSVYALAPQKKATLAVLGPTILRLRTELVSGRRGRLDLVVSPLGRGASAGKERRHSRDLSKGDVEIPIHFEGPVQVTLQSDVALRFRSYLRVARARSLEPLSDRLFAAKVAVRPTAPSGELRGRGQGSATLLATRPIQRPPVTLSAGLRFGAEEVAGDPEQELYPQLALVIGMASRPWKVPLYFDVEGRAIFSDDSTVTMARAGFDWLILRGRAALSLTGDIKLAHGAPDGLSLTSLGGALRVQGEYWATPRIQVLGRLRYTERDALSGGRRSPELSYGRVSMLWSAYRQDHPRALSALVMGRLMIGRYLRYGLYAWAVSNASTDQALVDHLGVGSYLDAIFPGVWARAGADVERRAADAHREAAYASPEVFARAAWTLWPAGYMGLQATAAIRYQFHFENTLLTFGLRGFLSRDRALRDLRPSRTLYKSAASWWQDRRADTTYGSAVKGGGG